MFNVECWMFALIRVVRVIRMLKVTLLFIPEVSLPTATLAAVALAKVAAYCHFTAPGRWA
jgi:hypothetical protein